jgi:hypothetical protein
MIAIMSFDRSAIAKTPSKKLAIGSYQKRCSQTRPRNTRRQNSISALFHVKRYRKLVFEGKRFPSTGLQSFDFSEAQVLLSHLSEKATSI